MNLATIMFWKKKNSSSPERERIIPLPPLQESPLDTVQANSIEDIGAIRNELKVLQLERQIIGSSLATIFESESKGIINVNERIRLVGKYKVNLEQLEKSIDQHQSVVERHDLELSRQELVKEFNLKMSELDEKIKNLSTGNFTISPSNDSLDVESSHNESLPVNDAEKRVEQIRDEILKAMDRLEQIESEG